MMLLDSSGSVQQEGFNYGKRGIKVILKCFMYHAVSVDPCGDHSY